MAARRAIVAAGICPSATLERVRPTPRALLLWAGGCAALFVVLLTVAYASDAARRVDASALTGFVDLERPAASGVTARLGALADPLGVAVIGAGLAAVALARGRPRAALAVLAVLGATSVSSQVLKSVLAYPRYEGLPEDLHISPAAFPSGHATAAMALALAAVLVAPRRARPLAAFVGLGFALAVSFSVLVQGWHFPSDVVGGYLLAAGWTFAVAAALLAAPRGSPNEPRAAVPPSASGGRSIERRRLGWSPRRSLGRPCSVSRRS